MLVHKLQPAKNEIIKRIKRYYKVIFNRKYQPTSCTAEGTSYTAITALQSQSYFTILSYILSSIPTEFKYESPMHTNQHKYYFKLSLFKIGNKEENYYKGALHI